MEAFSNNTYDGPQLDDIRGAQQQYGDVFEKSNGGTGNNTPTTATNLGTLLPNQSILKGVDATLGTVIAGDKTDFLSITNHNDLDYFSFTTTAATTVNIALTPAGASYNERPNSSSSYTTTNPSSVSDLSLDIYRLYNGVATLLQSSNSHSIGQAESVQNLVLNSGGQYLARVSGSTDVVQLYELGIDAISSFSARRLQPR